MFARTTLYLTVFITATIAASARGQSAIGVGAPSALARAIVLHDSAVSLYSRPDRAAEAAQIHTREAAFRSPTDPEAINALVMAGRLYAYAHRPFAACKTLEQ